MQEFNIIRHGEKLEAGEERVPLEESGLSGEQQRDWKESVERLGLENPELSYRAVPKIEKLGQEIFESLPEGALVIFGSTNTPRTKLTADLLSKKIMELSVRENKNITVAFIWEPEEIKGQPGSLSSIPMYPPEISDAIKKIQEQDEIDDKIIKDYLEKDGGFAHPKEEEWVMKAVNDDLAGEDSFMRRRADLLKSQYEKLKEAFGNENRAIFFYGLGHHSSLLALDVCFNGRKKYDSVAEMPQPLSLWKADLKQ